MLFGMTLDAAWRAPLTTIKVPVPLRERIADDAAGMGVTAAAFLARLVDRYKREQRLAAVGRAYQEEEKDDDYAGLTREWDALSGADVDGD
jgi:hypothetical protein